MWRWPNKFLFWLIEWITRGPYGDALLGDVLEEYDRRRNDWWHFRQLAAIGWLASKRRIATLFLWSTAEASTILAMVVLADSCRRGFRPFAWRLLLIAVAIDAVVIVVLAEYRRTGSTNLGES
jgi:hypothetical protein